MHIRTVEYSRLHNLGNYENESLKVVVELQEGDDPAFAKEGAKQFVEKELCLSSEDKTAKLNRLQAQLRDEEEQAENEAGYRTENIERIKNEINELELQDDPELIF